MLAHEGPRIPHNSGGRWEGCGPSPMPRGPGSVGPQPHPQPLGVCNLDRTRRPLTPVTQDPEARRPVTQDPEARRPHHPGPGGPSPRRPITQDVLTEQCSACCTWIPRILSASSFRDGRPLCRGGGARRHVRVGPGQGVARRALTQGTVSVPPTQSGRVGW